MLRHRCLGIALSLAFATAAARAGAENDPDLDWWTIETAHFRIDYEKGLEPVAERMARLGEQILRELKGPLGYEPRQKTEILLTDTTDVANGVATPVPYNQIRLFVTAPADLSPLHDYEDWYLGLLTHEYTHILHTDNISGAPEVINDIIGKTLSPNSAQPRWILEGLAVISESAYTSGGRIRSSLFDAYLRADILGDKFAGLDQISSNAQRWPEGNLWYLYGSRFLYWIREVYGKDALRAVSADYGATLVPWGINRAIRRQTGRTYEQLYRGFHDYLVRGYDKQLRQVRRRGVRAGRRVTFAGRNAFYPAFVPDRSRWQPDAGGYQIAYYQDDLNDRTGVYLLRTSPIPNRPELVARAIGESPVAFAPDGSMLFGSTVPFKQIYDRSELFSLPRSQRAPIGEESYRKQLTHGLRATAPTISPDGRRVAFAVNSRGTTSIWAAERGPDGELTHARQLILPERQFDQAYTPAFSPDGTKLAYSAWRAGGWRDVRIVELGSGAVTEVTHDRSIDLDPAWSPDGSRLYFSSDRTGIFNVYEYALDSGLLKQVTNVEVMAVMPAVSPDGKMLCYVGYGWAGYDLYLMPLDPARYLDASPPPDDRPEPLAEPSRVPYRRGRYNPLPTLGPRSYGFSYGQGNFGGNALTLTASGADIAGLHAFDAAIVADAGAPLPQIGLDYSYLRMPFDLGISVSNHVTPRSDDRISGQSPTYLEKSYQARTSLSYRRLGEFANETFGLSYTAAIVDSHLPGGVVLDPNAATTTVLPQRSFLGTVHAGYAINRVEYGLDTPGPARGYAISVGADAADQATGSDESLYDATYYATAYLPMPFAHHVLALRSGGGWSGGTFARRGFFYVGGYNLANYSPLDVVTSSAFNGAFVLRGFPVSAYHGTSYLLQTAEYRFPIAVPDVGPSSLPVYLRRIDGNLFVDYGGAFDTFDFRAVKFFSKGALIDSPQLHTGVGGELWFGATVGYVLDLNLRLGYAFGFSAERIPGGQLYFLASSAF